jgi:hypothetical protein
MHPLEPKSSGDAVTCGLDLIYLDICKEPLISVAQLNFCVCSKSEAGYASNCIN